MSDRNTEDFLANCQSRFDFPLTDKIVGWLHNENNTKTLPDPWNEIPSYVISDYEEGSLVIAFTDVREAQGGRLGTNTENPQDCYTQSDGTHFILLDPSKTARCGSDENDKTALLTPMIHTLLHIYFSNVLPRRDVGAYGRLREHIFAKPLQPA